MFTFPNGDDIHIYLLSVYPSSSQRDWLRYEIVFENQSYQKSVCGVLCEGQED